MNQPEDSRRIDQAGSQEPAAESAPAVQSVSAPRPRRTSAPRRLRRLAWSAAPVAALVLVVGAIGLIRGSWGKTEQRLAYHTVGRSTLTIDVLERGTLESVEEIDILCEVESLAGSGGRSQEIQRIFLAPI